MPLPLPPFYDPRNAAKWAYAPDQSKLFALAAGWRAQHDLRPAASDARKVHLLLVDVQKDFCFPEGSLYVGGRSGQGALDDNRRTAEFLYRNLDVITQTTCTLDSHLPFQIFSPSFWVDREGAPLTAHRTITVAQVRAGEVRPNPALGWIGTPEELRLHAEHYCAELEREGKYTLYLWPPHCLIGSDGHALVGLVHEARLFHAYARSAQAAVTLKGDHPLTENYSALAPEVLTRHDGSRLAEPNEALVKTLLEADVVVVAGQAASHCVKSTVEDLLAALADRDPAAARKVHLLVDCMSAVVAPGADFTPQTEEALLSFEARGVRLVRSDDPSWLR